MEEQEALPGRCPTAMCPTVSHCWRDTRLGAAGAGEPVLAQPDGARHGTEAPGVSTLAGDWVRTNLPGRAQPTPRSFLSYLQEINVHRSASFSKREQCWCLAGHPAEDQPGWSTGHLLFHGPCLPWGRAGSSKWLNFFLFFCTFAKFSFPGEKLQCLVSVSWHLFFCIFF